jgi:hypothetical protein
MHRLLVFPAFFVLITLISCGWESNGPDYLRDAYGSSCNPKDTANTLVGDAQVIDTPAASIAGHWAMKVTQKGTFKPVGDEWGITLTELVLVHIPADGSGVYFTFCDELMDVDTKVKNDQMKPVTHIGQALKDTLVGTMVSLNTDDLKKLPKMDVLWLWGLKDMKDPATDTLPDSPGPQVWDQDGDGNPGVTIEVEKPIPGKRYMVRRNIWHMQTGTPDKDFLWITGDLSYKLDESAVGATNSLLKTIAPITPDKTGNNYVMRRVLPGLTCKELVDGHEKIFGGMPQP